MSRATAFVLAALLLTACRPEPPPPPAQTRAPAPVVEPPPVDPGSLDQVTALAVDERSVFLGGEAGIARLDPLSGAYSLLPEAEGLPSAGVSGLVLAEDGSLWSTHRRDPHGEGAGGGVRAFVAGEGRPRAWSAADGLGNDDVAALAISSERVVVAVGEALAQRRLDGSQEGFERFFEEDNRRMQVLRFDEDGAVLRRVIEFRPRGEQVLALALAEPRLWIGTTHGLYRLDPEGLVRYEIPCRVDNRPPRRVTSLAATPDGVVAVLGLDAGEGEWRPGGLLELEGDAAHRCHQPDLDVPDATSLSVAHGEGRTWLATYEGPTRIEGPDSELLDLAAGAPDLPASAVALAPDGSLWAGTWGGGAWHLVGERWATYRLGGALGGTATIERGELLADERQR